VYVIKLGGQLGGQRTNLCLNICVIPGPTSEGNRRSYQRENQRSQREKKRSKSGQDIAVNDYHNDFFGLALLIVTLSERIIIDDYLERALKPVCEAAAQKGMDTLEKLHMLYPFSTLARTKGSGFVMGESFAMYVRTTTFFHTSHFLS
jgi:hypothetical protein